MLSPDPVTQAPENGQNYNRYSYVFNNPLKYTDPNGFAAKDNPGFTRCNAVCRLMEWIAENASVGPAGIGVRIDFGGSSRNGHDSMLPSGYTGVADASGALNHGTSPTLSGGENVPMSASGYQVGNDREATLLSHIVASDFGAFAEENPLEFVLFIEFASQYSAIKHGQNLDAYMDGVASDFDAYAQRRAADILESGLGTLGARIGGILYGPSGTDLLGALPGPWGVLGGAASDTSKFVDAMNELDPYREAFRILSSGAALRGRLLEGSLAGEE